jgi:hypothetical protein
VVLLLCILCGEMCLLVSLCVGDNCDMMGSDRDLGKSRRPSAENRGWSSTGRVLGGQTIGRSGDVVCGLHHVQGDGECRFPGLASKPWSSGFLVWASNPTALVS